MAELHNQAFWRQFNRDQLSYVAKWICDNNNCLSLLDFIVCWKRWNSFILISWTIKVCSLRVAPLMEKMFDKADTISLGCIFLDGLSLKWICITVVIRVISLDTGHILFDISGQSGPTAHMGLRKLQNCNISASLPFIQNSKSSYLLDHTLLEIRCLTVRGNYTIWATHRTRNVQQLETQR